MGLNLSQLQAHLRHGLIWIEQPAWPLLADWLAGRGMPLTAAQAQGCQAHTDRAWQRLALASGWLLLAPDWGILTPADNRLFTPAFGQLAAVLGTASFDDAERQEELIRWWLRAWGRSLAGESLAQAEARWEVISSQEAESLAAQIARRRQRQRAVQAALLRARAGQEE